jgi:hypothetical protein
MRHRNQNGIIDHQIINRALTILSLLWLLGAAEASPTNAIRQAIRLQPVGTGQLQRTVNRQQSRTQPEIGEEEIKEARRLLSELGYWVNLDSGGPDLTLRHALVAFQKIEGRPRTGVLTAAELEAIRHAPRPQARETGYAHLEVDLNRQVLLMVDDQGSIPRILPVSTGSGELFTEGGRTRRAVTPTGRFTIAYKIEGWRKSPLGLLYYPNYIYNGIAIHGNPSVPVRPASHGCIRIPMFAAKEFYEMATVGTIVLIYDDRQAGQSPPLAAQRPGPMERKNHERKNENPDRL